jgi:tetratricopeptide (TPR) repeat protein
MSNLTIFPLNLQVCRQRLGQHALAENLFQEAVQIREQCLGPDHLEVAASLSKLGAAQTALGKFDEAFEKLRKAVKIAVDALGHNHKTVAQMLCHLACLYFEAGELMSSEATFQDALEIYRGVWSSAIDRDACMTQLTDTLCNVGSIQNRRKRFTAACASFSEALDLQRGIVAPDDARIVSTLDNLGYSYSKLKDYAAALQCYRKMYRAQVSAGGNTFTTGCFETFRKQILMFEKLRRYQEAIDETKETLQLQKSLLPRDHGFIAHTKDLLEELKQKQRRAATATDS